MNERISAPQWLAAELAERRASNPRYSLRLFARKLGFSPGRLSEYIAGKRSLTLKQAAKIADRLSYSSLKRRRFFQCVDHEGILGLTEPAELDASYRKLSADAFTVVADWYHFAILSLMDLDEFKTDAGWVSARLGISKKTVKDALSRLCNVGLIEKKNGRWLKSASDHMTTEDVPSVALKISHKQRSFSYCIETDPNFGTHSDDLPRAIGSVIDEWREYATERIHVPTEITFNGQLQPACTATTDLKIYFDVNNSETDPYTQSGKQVAIAVRTSYDADAGWGKGFIWLAKQGSIQPGLATISPIDPVFPNWAAPLTLHAVLLHEFGHVFGNGHISETIMDAHLADYILAHNDNSNQIRLAAIDGYQQLLDHPPYSGVLGLSPKANPMFGQTCIGDIEINFRLLTGKEPVGEVQAQLSPSKTDAHEMNLAVTDDNGTHSIRLHMAPQDSPGFDIDPDAVQPVFKVVKHSGVTAPLHGSSSSDLEIFAETGQILMGTYEHNRLSMFNLGDNGNGGISYGFEATGNVLTYSTAKGPRFLFVTATRSTGLGKFDTGGDPTKTCE